MASVSEEEENYIRLSLLLTGISPRAVRPLFNKEFVPAVLPATINRDFTKLKHNGILSTAQWNTLTTKQDSNYFDVSLMICLLMNFLSKGRPYRHGLPLPTDLSVCADLARIRHYRNLISPLSDCKLDSACFVTAWKDITEVIGRRGGKQMVDECAFLRVKSLDQTNKEIMLEITRSTNEINSLKKKVNTLKRSSKSLQDEIENMDQDLKRSKTDHAELERSFEELRKDNVKKNKQIETLQNFKLDTVPWNIREQIKVKLAEWKEKDKSFVETSYSKALAEFIKKHNCITVTGSFGVGKTVTIRHIALQFAIYGYDVISVTSPDDMVKLSNPHRKTLFMVDDVCGKQCLLDYELRRWETKLEDIQLLLKEGHVNIIVALRLQVLQDREFKRMTIFYSHIFNLEPFITGSLPAIETWYHRRFHSEEYHSTSVNKWLMDTCLTEIKLLSENKQAYSKYCVLALCVLFNNRIWSEWLSDDAAENTNIRSVIKMTLRQCRLPSGTSHLTLLDELETMQNTFISTGTFCGFGYSRDFYCCSTDKVFEILVYHFGKQIPGFIIKYADFRVLSEKFVFESQNADELKVVVPSECMSLYFDRLTNEWSKEQLDNVFENINFTNPDFRYKLLTILTKQDQSLQYKLASCKPKDIYSINYPLLKFCHLGDINLIKWCIDNGSDINQQNGNKTCALHIACEKGYIDIVKFMLCNKANLNLRDCFGRTPLMLASDNDNKDIVRLLLSNKAIVTIIGHSSIELYSACLMGHTDIVRLLLVDAINNQYSYNGQQYIEIAETLGSHDIVKLLKESQAVNKDLIHQQIHLPVTHKSRDSPRHRFNRHGRRPSNHCDTSYNVFMAKCYIKHGFEFKDYITLNN